MRQCFSLTVLNPEWTTFRKLLISTKNYLTSPYLASRAGKASGTADALSMSEECPIADHIMWKLKSKFLGEFWILKFWMHTYGGLTWTFCYREIFLPEGGTLTMTFGHFAIKKALQMNGFKINWKDWLTIFGFVSPGSHLFLILNLCLKLAP